MAEESQLVNNGHYVELLDRIHIINCNIDDYLISHRLTEDIPLAKKYFETAQEILFNAYQLVGNLVPDDKVY